MKDIMKIVKSREESGFIIKKSKRVITAGQNF